MPDTTSQAADLLCGATGRGQVGMAGTPTAWEEFAPIYEECLPVVLRYALARVGNPAVAEDLVGDTFERALRGWPTFRRSAAARTWILGIARHVIADYWRRGATIARHAATLPGELPRTQGPTLEEAALRSEEVCRLHQAIALLSEQEQDLLALRYGAELPLREVARALGLHEIATRVRLHRTLRRLRRFLHEED